MAMGQQIPAICVGWSGSLRQAVIGGGGGLCSDYINNCCERVGTEVG